MLDYEMINDVLSARHHLLSDMWTTVTTSGDVIFNLENGDTVTINIKDDLTNLPAALNDELLEYEASFN